jgi:pimeloyl-ACP methyl ester carboxylesterase
MLKLFWLVVLIAGGTGIFFAWQHFGKPPVVEVPVVLVHGYGGKGTTWLARNYNKAMDASREYQYRGNLVTSNGIVVLEAASDRTEPVQHPCYTVCISNSAFGDIRESGRELSTFVARVMELHKARQVVLVGFSLGGVICREYLTSPAYAGQVCTLITISSPHNGSEYSCLYDMNKETLAWLDEQTIIARNQKKAAGTAALMALQLARRGQEKLRAVALEHHIDFTSRALDMLHPPMPGNYVDTLNSRVHPAGVAYISIVTSKGIEQISLANLQTDWEKVKAGKGEIPTVAMAFSDFIRRCMGLFGDAPTSAGLGDGFCSTDSQNLKNVRFFREHPEIPVKVINVESAHLDDTIQKELVLLLIPGKGGR